LNNQKKTIYFRPIETTRDLCTKPLFQAFMSLLILLMFGAAVGIPTGLIFTEKSKNENTGNERFFTSEIKKKLGILLKSKSEFFD